MVCEIRIIATTRRHGPWQINSRRQHVGDVLVLCSSYSYYSDSVNELKRIKTRGQTFIQPCVDGALVNRITPPAGAGGEEAFNQIKASYIHKPQVGAIHDHQQRYSTIIMGSVWTDRSGDDNDNTAEVNIYYYYG